MVTTRSSINDLEFQGLSASCWSYRARKLLRRLYKPLERAENELLRMRNFSTLAEQLAFLALADRLLLPYQGRQQRLSCLYSLMFYNVIAYCICYVKELASKEDWSPYVTLTASSNIRHLAMSATKIVLEWTKAVTFLVTLAFTLIVFGFEQTLHNYKPTLLYSITTLAYYAATEKVFIDMFPSILTHMQFDALESLESFYAPVILRIFTISLSALFVLALLPRAPWRFLFMASYLNVFLRSKELMQKYLPDLQKERQALSKYRKATVDEIKEFDDVCAVCLSPMTTARITPCQHIFHASCLRECLKTSDNCPMCKQPLVFS